MPTAWIGREGITVDGVGETPEAATAPAGMRTILAALGEPYRIGRDFVKVELGNSDHDDHSLPDRLSVWPTHPPESLVCARLVRGHHFDAYVSGTSQRSARHNNTRRGFHPLAPNEREAASRRPGNATGGAHAPYFGEGLACADIRLIRHGDVFNEAGIREAFSCTGRGGIDRRGDKGVRWHDSGRMGWCQSRSSRMGVSRRRTTAGSSARRH